MVAIDPGENAVVKAIRLNPTPGPVAAGAGGVWVLSRGSSTISRIDPEARRPTRSFGLGKTPDNVAVAGEVWVSGGCSEGGNPGTLLHPFTGARGGIALDEEIPLERAFPGESPRLAPVEAGTRCGIAAAGQSVWVATNLPQGIVRVDYDRVAAQSRIVRSVALPRAPLAVAVGFGSVWATDNELNLIRRIDPDTGRTTRSIQVGNDPVAIVAGAGAVWVANRGDARSLASTRRRTRSPRRSRSAIPRWPWLSAKAPCGWRTAATMRSIGSIRPRTGWPRASPSSTSHRASPWPVA